MPLYHFSEDPGIEVFVPRPVLVPSDRGPGNDWMNGPLVWAIDEQFQAMYLFPRDCPRIVMFRKADTTDEDLAIWWGSRDCHAIAHIEWAWWERVSRETLCRYTLPEATFESLGDAGMHVSHEAVTPLAVETFGDLPAAMRAMKMELRILERLTPLWDLWSTSLHVSGNRLRHAQGWDEEAMKRRISAARD